MLTDAVFAGSIESWFAPTFEVTGFGDEEAEGVGVAQHLFSVNLARVGAFLLRGGADITRRGVFRAAQADCLKCLGLVVTLGARQALGVRQEGASDADGERTLLQRRGAGSLGRAVGGATDARRVDALGAVGASRTRLARAGGAQLETRLALLAAFGGRDGLLGARGEAAVAPLAGELAFIRLEVSVAAGAADAHLLVEVPSSSTALLAVLGRTGPGNLGHALATRSLGTGLAGDLAHLVLVGSQLAKLAGFALGTVVCARRAVHAFAADYNLWMYKQLIMRTSRIDTMQLNITETHNTQNTHNHTHKNTQTHNHTYKTKQIHIHPNLHITKLRLRRPPFGASIPCPRDRSTRS